MRTRFWSLILLIALFASFAIQPAAAQAHSMNSANLTSGLPGAWVDEFDGASLAARWSWVREDPALWSLTATPGALQLTANGTLFSNYNNAKNILLTPAPLGDFEMTVHMGLNPQKNYQAGALILYQDDDHFLDLSRDFNNSQSVEFNKWWGTDFSERWYDGTGLTDVYLRVVKHGNVYQGFVSADGVAWNGMGAQTLDFTSLKVGVYAPVGVGSALPVNVYSFALTPLPALHTVMTDGFNAATLGKNWSWVREDPTHWSLSAAPGNLRIISQDGTLFSTYNNAKNLLLMDLPLGDFQFTTKVNFAPVEQYQYAGILLYQDDDHYLSVARAFGSPNKIIETRYETPEGGYHSSSRDYADPTVYLRLIRQGSDYFSQYSADGVNWFSAGEATLSLTNLKIGLTVVDGETPLETPADFDFVTLEKSAYAVNLPVVARYQPQGTWSVVNSPTQTKLSGISALSANNVWVVGANPMNGQPKNAAILHWDGINWQNITPPSSDDLLLDVKMLTPTDGWVVGTCRVYQVNQIMNGIAWASYPVPACNYINKVDMLSSTDVWASSVGAVIHWDGKAWSNQSLLSDAPILNSIDMLSPTDGWLTTSTFSNEGRIYHWDGANWNLSAHYADTHIQDIQMLSSTDGWAVGSNGMITHWDGQTWTQVASPVTTSLFGVSMASAKRGWAVGGGNLLEWDGFHWTAAPAVTGSVNTVEAVSETEAWAVGWDGLILHYLVK